MAGAKRHYLDYNATSLLRPEARAEMVRAMDEGGNPSSVHHFGRQAQQIVEGARAEVADFAVRSTENVIFTSGATEASNLALLGCGRSRLIVSSVEHDASLAVARSWRGDVVTLPVSPDGLVDLAALKDAVTDRGANTIVSVMAANNETGTLQPIDAVGDLCRAAGALLHVDAVQAVGKISFDAIAAYADLISISAHKIGGPAGIGALILRDGLDVRPQILGGGQERKRRSGTENLIGIAGFGAALAAARAEMGDGGMGRIRAMRDRLETALRSAVPDLTVFSSDCDRLPNTSCILMPGVPAELQVMMLDLDGVAVSAGSACSSGKVTPSHVLTAMGFSEAEAAQSIRISFGWGSEEADVDAAVRSWLALWRRKGQGNAT